LLGRPKGTIASWLHRGRRHLAAEMEAYAPMTPAQQETAAPAEAMRTAALIHTDLEPALLQKVAEALKAGGYDTKSIVPVDLSHLAAALKGCDFIVLDEWIHGRSALELLINLRAAPETKELRTCVLCSDPSGFTITAYFIVG